MLQWGTMMVLHMLYLPRTNIGSGAATTQQQPFNATFEDADFLGHWGANFEHMGPYC